MESSKLSEQPSSCSTPTPRWIHDVFLSFRGEDTRHTFTDDLYKALIQKGIHTFRDDDELRRGEDIATELLKAINESRIAIIVFSKNYASSRWCLDELAEIMDCRDKNGMLVVPVFYDVHPSVVQTQSESFGKAFVSHEMRFAGDMKKVQKWRVVLTQAATLSGFNLQDASAGIQSIVEEVSTKLNQIHLNIAVYPVGIESRVKDMHFLLSIGSNDVRIIGIHGMGGVGKTAIAKAIYNEVFHKFEGSSFLTDVREASEQLDGLVQLQEQLLSDILMNRNLEIGNVDGGSILIKERLCHKRVLIVLDDVDQAKQLNALAGMHDWFGPGSRIIITTRDQELLNELGVDEKYEAKELDPEQSLELFSWHAFKKDKPVKDYEELANAVVGYVGGLPLALEVLGSFLCDKKSISEWKCELEKLKVYPHNQLKNRLLNDVKEMDILLDIACFFVGMDKDYAMKILDGCHVNSEAGISALTRRSLVTINGNNEFRMTDLLRDIGRGIVHEEFPKEREKRSRLWSHHDAYEVLGRGTGTAAVKGLILNYPGSREVQLSTKAFSKMSKLRLLQLNYVQLTGSYEHFSKELRWLCWHGFPLKCIPIEFCLDNLIVLDMQYSSLKQVWPETREISTGLKILNLSHSIHLTRTPDFLGLSSLEKLMLEGCTSLVELHQSIGDLHRLVLLNLGDCKNLKNLPSSICKLKALESLSLTGCSKLDKLPEDLGEMDSLTYLFADKSGIEKLPSSIGLLKNLRSLSLRGCKESPFKSWLPFFWGWGSRRSPDSITLLQGLFERGTKLDIFVRGDEVPDWFTHQCEWCSISFEVLPLCNHKILGLTLCAVYASNKQTDIVGPLFDGDEHTSPPAKITVESNNDVAYFYPNVKDIPITHQDHIWVCHVPCTEFGNRLEGEVHIKVSVEMGEPLKVKKCGIHVQNQEKK